jgi:hypothetical protein
LSVVLVGEPNHPPGAATAAHHLVLLGFLQKTGELWQITEQGRAALA